MQGLTITPTNPVDGIEGRIDEIFRLDNEKLKDVGRVCPLDSRDARRIIENLSRKGQMEMLDKMRDQKKYDKQQIIDVIKPYDLSTIN